MWKLLLVAESFCYFISWSRFDIHLFFSRGSEMHRRKASNSCPSLCPFGDSLNWANEHTIVHMHRFLRRVTELEFSGLETVLIKRLYYTLLIYQAAIGSTCSFVWVYACLFAVCLCVGASVPSLSKHAIALNDWSSLRLRMRKQKVWWGALWLYQTKSQRNIK